MCRLHNSFVSSRSFNKARNYHVQSLPFILSACSVSGHFINFLFFACHVAEAFKKPFMAAVPQEPAQDDLQALEAVPAAVAPPAPAVNAPPLAQPAEAAEPAQLNAVE